MCTRASGRATKPMVKVGGLQQLQPSTFSAFHRKVCITMLMGRGAWTAIGLGERIVGLNGSTSLVNRRYVGEWRDDQKEGQAIEEWVCTWAYINTAERCEKEDAGCPEKAERGCVSIVRSVFAGRQLTLWGPALALSSLIFMLSFLHSKILSTFLWSTKNILLILEVPCWQEAWAWYI